MHSITLSGSSRDKPPYGPPARVAIVIFPITPDVQIKLKVSKIIRPITAPIEHVFSALQTT